MYYGFSGDRCVWSSDHPTEPIEGILVVQDANYYNISDITVDLSGAQPAIIPKPIDWLARNTELKTQLLANAKRQMELLADEAELSGNPELHKTELAQWREFRISTYAIDPLDEEMEWVTSPL